MELELLDYFLNVEKITEIAAEVSFKVGDLHWRTDISLMRDYEVWEIEIKTYEEDVKNEYRKKAAKHALYKRGENDLIPERFYYAMPEKLIPQVVHIIDDRYGILTIKDNELIIVREASLLSAICDAWRYWNVISRRALDLESYIALTQKYLGAEITLADYKTAQKEQRKAQAKAYCEANREQIKAYREANREQIKAQRKAYRAANREQRKAYNEAYNKANREQRNAYTKAYRAKKKAEKIAQDQAFTVGYLFDFAD